MIPNFELFIRPVLECATEGEVHIRDVEARVAEKLGLSQNEREELVPSGKQTRLFNRVSWAKTYLKQAVLVKATKRRGYFVITDRGRQALTDSSATINFDYLKQFEEFQEFKSRPRKTSQDESVITGETDVDATPDEALRSAHEKINTALSAELLSRVREEPPTFLEGLIVELLLAMGYGGTSEDAGQSLGKSGDDGVDGVIDQDPLGVDQIYVQAKRYTAGNNIGAGAIREFFGALSLKKAQKGIFVTTSSFTPSAEQTAKNFDIPIVLINGGQLARLMIRYNIGCRDEEVLRLKKVDEDFFN